MKKYSDKHLEGILPEAIDALERTVYRLKSGESCNKVCPKTMLPYVRPSCFDTCLDVLLYDSLSCPCHHLGREDAILFTMNLITQWKKWARVDE